MLEFIHIYIYIYIYVCIYIYTYTYIDMTHSQESTPWLCPEMVFLASNYRDRVENTAKTVELLHSGVTSIMSMSMGKLVILHMTNMALRTLVSNPKWQGTDMNISI